MKMKHNKKKPKKGKKGFGKKKQTTLNIKKFKI